jgi:hypothetical protein
LGIPVITAILSHSSLLNILREQKLQCYIFYFSSTFMESSPRPAINDFFFDEVCK